MGGVGSTRWLLYTKKTTVEACRVLDIRSWTRTRLVQPNVRQAGAWVWVDAANAPIAAIGYVVDTTDMVTPWVEITYTTMPARVHVRYTIALATIAVHRGGIRWAWRCPLVRDGVACTQRVERVYLPPGRTYFACRRCHDLVYRSSQEGHRYDQLAHMTGLRPRQVRQAMATNR
jgi:hypothetical protein